MTDECSTSLLLGRLCVKPNWIVVFVFNSSVSVTASAATSKIIPMKTALKLQCELQIRMIQ